MSNRMTTQYSARISSSRPANKSGHFRVGVGSRKTYTLMDQVVRTPDDKVSVVDVKRIYYSKNDTYGVIKFEDCVLKVRRIGASTCWEIVSQ